MRILVAVNRHAGIKRRLRGLAERIPLPSGERPVRMLVGPIRGMRLPLDLATIDRHLWFNTYEPWVQSTLLSVLKPHMVVWDVGAFIGYYVALVSRVTGGGPVLAVEPDPANLARLQQTIALNGLPQVTVVTKAIGAQIGTASFASSGPIGSLSQEEGVVGVTTVDALLEEHPAPGVLLMDIEGGEVAAIQGASRLLSVERPIVIVELHGEAGVVAARQLEGLGYRLVTQTDAPVAAQMLHTHRVHVLGIPD